MVSPSVGKRKPVSPQKRVIWLVSGIPSRAPAALSCSIWVLDTLGHAAENSSMEMKCFPSRCSRMDQAAVSPRPGMAVKGGMRARYSRSTRKRVAWDS